MNKCKDLLQKIKYFGIRCTLRKELRRDERIKKGDLYYIQLLDYTSKGAMRPDAIIIH